MGIVTLVRRERAPVEGIEGRRGDREDVAGAAGDRIRSRSSRWSRSWEVALALLLLFGVWVAASAAWGEHPELALVKGGGYVLLTLGAGVLGWSGLAWERALDAWLLGAGLMLGVVAGVVFLGPESWSGRMLHQGGWLSNEPWARLRGPFAHPGGFGDYLVISGIFLWARWPAWTAPGGEAPHAAGLRSARTRRILAWTAAGVLAVALLLSASTAWLPAGILLLVWGRRLTPRRRKDAPDAEAPGAGAWIRSLGLRAGGATLAAVTLAALVFPLRIAWRGIEVASLGIGPALWSNAVSAFLRAPVLGVGAVPDLVAGTGPGAGVGGAPSGEAGAVLGDAGSVYLGVLGQFGLVGFLLAAVAAVILVRALRRPLRPDGSPDLAVVREEGGGRPPGSLLRNRARVAMLAALLAMGIHGLAVAGEDFRHWWAVVGMAGMVAGSMLARPRAGSRAASDGPPARSAGARGGSRRA